jgi:hypothetical protein
MGSIAEGEYGYFSNTLYSEHHAWSDLFAVIILLTTCLNISQNQIFDFFLSEWSIQFQLDAEYSLKDNQWRSILSLLTCWFSTPIRGISIFERR